MNIFEKLIDELKEENLLEETVIETNGKYNSDNKVPLPIKKAETKDEMSISSEEILSDDDEKILNDVEETGFEFTPTAEEDSEICEDDEALEAKVPDSVEFFYRRAKEEVASLQMVELILSGVERDQMKIIPKTFDDLAVNTALHKFGIAAEKADSSDQSQAEFLLMQETENWYSALSQRDKNITVGHLRRFCETTRPALSSQAMLALARFYRNAPYSEAVRSKFDLIITRLLTREIENDKRELVFDRTEIIKHLEGLYAEWSSISLYSPDKDDSTTVIAALKFEDFMSEAEEAETFDELINKDFFNRLRTVKESTSENFFAPVVTTAAIECNVKIGNRYIELLRAEDVNPEILIKKYGVLREEAISDIAGKTLQLAYLLNKQEIIEAEEETYPQTDEPNSEKALLEKKLKKVKTKKKSPFAVNKWLLIAAAIVIFGNIILFLATGETNSDLQTSAIVPEKVNLDNSVLKEHLKSARMSGGVFYGRIAPSWNGLSKAEKERYLQKLIVAGKEKGFTTAHLLNDQNRPVAYAGGEKVEISE